MSEEGSAGSGVVRVLLAGRMAEAGKGTVSHCLGWMWVSSRPGEAP